VLLEESILGWKEYELEVMRDHADNVVVVCSIENLDPMGVHTGDSITVAPALTLTDREYQRLRDIGIAIIREVGVDTGGCNIQFASTRRRPDHRHRDEPARVALLGAGVQGHRLPDRQDRGEDGHRLHPRRDPQRHHRGDPGELRADLDYVVVKVPRFAFEKFPAADDTLTTTMKSVGEAMAIGRNFTEALQKALRSLEKIKGARSFHWPDGDAHGRAGPTSSSRRHPAPHDGRIVSSSRRCAVGAPSRRSTRPRIDPWFLDQIALINEIAPSPGTPRL
jgi:carbamoyl-phosphate synthase large subunit